MRHVLLSLLVFGTVMTSAHGALWRTEWADAPGNTIDLAPSDTADLEVWIDLLAGESLSAVIYDNTATDQVEQIGTQVGPWDDGGTPIAASWSDGSVNDILSAPAQQVAWAADGLSDVLYGPGSFLIGRQSLKLLTGLPGETIDITYAGAGVPHADLVDEAGGDFI
ncbi:MAG: hypothetical protein GY842_08345 [bacterium]|nr:hypothetical protein [bacterium]